MRKWRLSEWLVRGSEWECVAVREFEPDGAMTKRKALTEECGAPTIRVNPEWDTVEFTWTHDGAKTVLSQFPCQ